MRDNSVVSKSVSILFDIMLEVVRGHPQLASREAPFGSSFIRPESCLGIVGKGSPAFRNSRRAFPMSLIASGFQPDSARIVICAAITVGSKFRSSNSCVFAHRSPKSLVKASIAAHLQHKAISPGSGFRSRTAYLRTLAILWPHFGQIAFMAGQGCGDLRFNFSMLSRINRSARIPWIASQLRTWAYRLDERS